MSLSRSPMWMHRAGSPRSSVDCWTFSNHRMLSFFSMGTRVGLIFFLSAAVPLNFFRVQNLTAAKPSGSPSVVTAKLECIRMPQNRVRSQATCLVAAAVDALGFTNRLGLLPLIGILGRIVEHQDRPIGGGCTISSRLKMAGQNVCFTDPLVGEKAICRLGVGPI